ncbi:MAG: hypothetical protein ACOZB1_10320 [Pseudomonadota bacterium]
MLPLQFSWAALSAYCGHEEGRAAQHFGHHDHQHRAAADGQDDAGSPAKPHSDCASCHLSAPGVAAAAPSASFMSCAFPLSSPVADDPPSVFLDGPERPKWLSAV